jgi:bis(5'-nucleosidyl)-tetraphosphatase
MIMKLREEKFLRDFISMTLAEGSNMRKNLSCGIVVVKKFEEEWRPLGLILGNKVDIPKGKKELGENIFQTAVRETFEESGINELNFQWGKEYFKFENLVVFVASTMQEPVIRPNPETGSVEHDYAKWMSWDTMIQLGSPKISQSLKWAKRKIKQKYL